MTEEKTIDIGELIQDSKNFNRGTDEGQQLMERSFGELGAGRSILIDRHGQIIAGNKSQRAAQAAGITKVRVIETDGKELIAVKRTDVDLDSAEGRRMALLDNLTTQVNLSWDESQIQAVTEEVEGFSVPDFGFDPQNMPTVSFPDAAQTDGEGESEAEAIERKKREFEEKMASGELSEDDPEYQEFLKKFEAKRTTDDCYTPEPIYEAVADWVATEYNVSRANFVRPFYPGGDYQREKYKPTDIVVDNPPFSILASIIDWYNERGIRYFLFGPQLTLLGTAAGRCTCLAVGVQITYANGADINTSFVTNMEDKGIAAKANARLYKMVNDANEANKETKKFPRYAYPKHVIMSPTLHKMSRFGFDFAVPVNECAPCPELDAQREVGKAIYGKGFLISDRLVNEREIIEKQIAEKEAEQAANATQWSLSDRERAIIAQLNQNK